VGYCRNFFLPYFAEIFRCIFLMKNKMENKRKNKAFLSLKGTATMLLMMLMIAACGNKSSNDKLTPFNEPQQYSGEIELDSSENVVLDISLSANAKQITEIKLSAEKLRLMPENVSEKQQDAAGSKQKVEFAFLEDAAMQTFMAITKTESGYNVVATDASGNTIISHLEFTGSFGSTNAVDIDNGKLQLTDAPLICDLTLTNSRIYGTVKVEIRGGATKTANVELKNITSK